MAKTMKAMKAMKALKAMKTRYGHMRKKLVVFNGTKTQTASGLTKADLVKNKRNKIVSKRQQAAGKKAYENIKGWTVAMQKARAVLLDQPFLMKKGTPLYKKTKEIYSK